MYPRKAGRMSAARFSLAQFVIASRRAQGLPDHITDADTLEKVATLLEARRRSQHEASRARTQPLGEAT